MIRKQASLADASVATVLHLWCGPDLIKAVLYIWKIFFEISHLWNMDYKSIGYPKLLKTSNIPFLNR